MPLAALFVESHPGSAALHVNILDAHFERRAYPGEGVHHERNQRPIAKAYGGGGVDGIEQRSRFLGSENRRLALLHFMLWPAHRARGIDRENVPDDEPVEQHPDSGKMHFHRWSSEAALQAFDVACDVNRLDVAEFAQPLALAPRREIDRCPGVSPSRIGVADISSEELDESAGGPRVGSKERRKPWIGNACERGCHVT